MFPCSSAWYIFKFVIFKISIVITISQQVSRPWCLTAYTKQLGYEELITEKVLTFRSCGDPMHDVVQLKHNHNTRQMWHIVVTCATKWSIVCPKEYALTEFQTAHKFYCHLVWIPKWSIVCSKEYTLRECQTAHKFYWLTRQPSHFSEKCAWNCKSILCYKIFIN